MFSLIITIVSIALVVALVVATVYYGGDATRQSAAKASATALINQASQIAAAGALTVSQGSAWPAAAPQFAQPFLAAMPVPPKSAYVEGTPAVSDWTYFDAGLSNHFIVADKIGKDVCLAVNKTQGVIGIPAAWDGKTIVQCYGRGVATTAGPLAYTFFFDPPGTTDVQKAAVADAIVAAANIGSPAVLASKGYPRLCPDNTSINTGLCVDPSGGGAGGAGGGGGGGGAGGVGSYGGLSCSGTYTTTAMSVSCTITNTFGNPMIVQQIRGYLDYTYLSAVPTNCVGQQLAPGAVCAFDLDAGFEGHPATGGPAVFADVTYGATGTGGATTGMQNNFTFTGAGGGGGGGAVAVGPPFVLDTFTGTGTLTSHVGEVGATWSNGFYGITGTLDKYTLDGAGNLLNAEGWRYGMEPSGAPAPGSNYYVEFEMAQYIDNDWNGDMSFETLYGYQVYMFLWAGGEQEIDGYPKNGDGWGDYVMVPPMLTGQTFVYRFEFFNGNINVIVDGVLYGVLPNAPKGQGKFSIMPPHEATISRIQAGNLQ